MPKDDIYKWVKIGGLLSFLPFVLVAGPFGGYFLGDLLVKKFGLPLYVLYIMIALGFTGSVVETVRILKFVIRAESKD